MASLQIAQVAQIREAKIDFGDLTVLVGPQATGKSIALQLLKLLVDTGYVQEELTRYGLDWSGQLREFLDIYFGEGMRNIWRGRSKIIWHGKEIDLEKVARRRRKSKEETLFFIPAQRVLTLRDGWPRPFTDYSAGDPFAVREFSEKLRLLMEQELPSEGVLFPQERRLKKAFRSLLAEQLFSKFSLSVDKTRSQKRLVLGSNGHPLPYMVWSAGQREFVPLLLGAYWLMPSTKVARRRDLTWVVIEELEMGLHPRAISVVLLLLLELLWRGYRVCISTHSPQVLEMVWALRRIRKGKGTFADVLDLFGAKGAERPGLQSIAEKSLTKAMRVYYFGKNGRVRDISNLDPSADLTEEENWGGLSEFSGRANEVVARVTSSA
jgi:AAA domain, putative AbiEii toxin, Type IV TA system